MAIISVSLSDEVVRDLDNLQKNVGSGRSDVVRAGIRQMAQDMLQKSAITDDQFAILVVTHADKYDSVAADIKVVYEHLIKTQLHTRLDENKCAEIFMVSGSGKGIRSMQNDFLLNKKMDSVKLVLL